MASLHFTFPLLVVLLQVVGLSCSPLFGTSLVRTVDEVAKQSDESPIIVSAFKNFVTAFNRSYINPLEVVDRLANYAATYRHLDEANRENAASGWATRFEPGIFADLSDEERHKLLMPMDKLLSAEFDRSNRSSSSASLIDSNASIALGSGPLPQGIDWRELNAVTPIKYQGNCGSCWAFATVAVIESQHAIAQQRRGGKQPKLITLSEQELLDCDPMNPGGCNGGYPHEALHYVQKNGLSSDKDYDYLAHKSEQCRIPPSPPADPKVHISTVRALDSEDEAAGWLAKNGPFLIGFYVSERFQSGKTNGVFDASGLDCRNYGSANHAVEIVGYGEEFDATAGKHVPYWVMKNSWGASWNSDGYVKIRRGANSCGLANYMYGAY